MLISSIIRGIILVEVLSFLALTTRLYEPNLLALKYVAYRLYTDFTNWLTFFSVKPISIASNPSPSAPITSGSNTIFSNPTSTTTEATTTAATTTAATTTAATTTAATTTAATTTTEIPSVITCTSTCDGACAEFPAQYGGIYYSPNYPNDYGSNQDCTYTFEVTPTSYKLGVGEYLFEAKTWSGSLSIYDGTSTTAAQTVTGTLDPEMDIYIGTTNKITVKFTSGNDNSGAMPSDVGKWKLVTFLV